MKTFEFFLISILTAGTVFTGCSKKKTEEAAAPLANTQKPVVCADIDTYSRPAYTKHASARTIPYKVTAKMFHKPNGVAVATPQVVLDKIHKSFALWESIPEANVKFTYAGLAADYYATIADVPRDGSIYIVLNNDNSQFVNTGFAGVGGMEGNLPATYDGGWVFMATGENIANLQFPVLVHEIGHALGLNHSVAPDSVMNCSESAFDHNDILGFNLQDRLNLMARHPAPGVTLYKIEGSAGFSSDAQRVVYAVNVLNGETYHAGIDNAPGTFSINVARAGSYRVFATSDPRHVYQQVTVSSWYLADGSSTTDPYAGSVVEVTASAPVATGVNFQMLTAVPQFNVFDWAEASTDFVTWNRFLPSQLRPGSSGDFQLASYGHEAVEWLESYGEKPDYSFTFNRAPGFAPMITVAACANAPQGPRLVVAKGGATVQAGLTGVSIIGSTLPSVVQAPPLDARNPAGPSASDNFLTNQLNVPYDFSAFDVNYWKN